MYAPLQKKEDKSIYADKYTKPQRQSSIHPDAENSQIIQQKAPVNQRLLSNKVVQLNDDEKKGLTDHLSDHKVEIASSVTTGVVAGGLVETGAITGIGSTLAAGATLTTAGTGLLAGALLGAGYRYYYRDYYTVGGDNFKELSKVLGDEKKTYALLKTYSATLIKRLFTQGASGEDIESLTALFKPDQLDVITTSGNAQKITSLLKDKVEAQFIISNAGNSILALSQIQIKSISNAYDTGGIDHLLSLGGNINNQWIADLSSIKSPDRLLQFRNKFNKEILPNLTSEQFKRLLAIDNDSLENFATAFKLTGIEKLAGETSDRLALIATGIDNFLYASKENYRLVRDIGLENLDRFAGLSKGAIANLSELIKATEKHAIEGAESFGELFVSLISSSPGEFLTVLNTRSARDFRTEVKRRDVFTTIKAKILAETVLAGGGDINAYLVALTDPALKRLTVHLNKDEIKAFIVRFEAIDLKSLAENVSSNYFKTLSANPALTLFNGFGGNVNDLIELTKHLTSANARELANQVAQPDITAIHAVINIKKIAEYINKIGGAGLQARFNNYTAAALGHYSVNFFRDLQGINHKTRHHLLHAVVKGDKVSGGHDYTALSAAPGFHQVSKVAQAGGAWHKTTYRINGGAQHLKSTVDNMALPANWTLWAGHGNTALTDSIRTLNLPEGGGKWRGNVGGGINIEGYYGSPEANTVDTFYPV